MTGATTHTQHEVIHHRVPSYIIGAGRRLIPGQRNYHFGLVSHYGVMATAEEMARYGMAVLEGKLLQADLLKLMWTPGALADSSPARTAYFAMAWDGFEPYRGRLLAYHPGSTGTALFLSPSDSLVVVVLTNLEQVSGNNVMTIARDIAGTFVPELTWWELEPSRDPDSTLTLKVKNGLTALAAGTADSMLYTAGFWRVLRPQLSAQGTGLSRLGALGAFTHLYTEPMGRDRVVAWTAAFPNEQWFIVRAVVKPDGRVDWLGLGR